MLCTVVEEAEPAEAQLSRLEVPVCGTPFVVAKALSEHSHSSDRASQKRSAGAAGTAKDTGTPTREQSATGDSDEDGTIDDYYKVRGN